MTVFAEPTVTLCGKRSPMHYAVCAKRIEDGKTDHDGPCVWVAAVDVMQKLSSTFTPCRWLHQVSE